MNSSIGEMKLRRLEAKDVDGMLEWMHDAEIQQNFRHPMQDCTRQDALEFIHRALTTSVDGGSVHFAIADVSDEYLGTISLKNFDMDSHNAEFALCLRRKAQGRGIGYGAIAELLRLAFFEFGLERVYLNVFSNNAPAIKLYEECGFVYEGEFKKHVFVRGEYRTLKYYRMLREEWEINPIKQFGAGHVMR